MNNRISKQGRVIKQIRHNKDMTRAKLNKLTGINNLTLYEIECGDIDTLSSTDLEKIAKALDMDVSMLLNK